MSNPAYTMNRSAALSWANDNADLAPADDTAEARHAVAAEKARRLAIAVRFAGRALLAADPAETREARALVNRLDKARCKAYAAAEIAHRAAYIAPLIRR